MSPKRHAADGYVIEHSDGRSVYVENADQLLETIAGEMELRDLKPGDRLEILAIERVDKNE